MLTGVSLLQVREFEPAVAGQRAARAVIARRTTAAVVSENKINFISHRPNYQALM